MGLLKQMRDLKQTNAAARDVIREAESPADQAEAEFAPISGVSIELYADISKGLSAYGYDPSKATEVAFAKGVTPDDWALAMSGWNERIRASADVARRFNQLYVAG